MALSAQGQSLLNALMAQLAQSQQAIDQSGLNYARYSNAPAEGGIDPHFSLFGNLDQSPITNNAALADRQAVAGYLGSNPDLAPWHWLVNNFGLSGGTPGFSALDKINRVLDLGNWANPSVPQGQPSGEPHPYSPVVQPHPSVANIVHNALANIGFTAAIPPAVVGSAFGGIGSGFSLPGLPKKKIPPTTYFGPH